MFGATEILVMGIGAMCAIGSVLAARAALKKEKRVH